MATSCWLANLNEAASERLVEFAHDDGTVVIWP